MMTTTLLLTSLFSIVHLSVSVTIMTRGGNSGGAPCVIPFKFQNQIRNEPIDNDFDRPWCPTEYDYDATYRWGVAEVPFTTKKTVGGTAKGAPCEFPFVYRGKTYYYCTNYRHTTAWCATTVSYDAEPIKQWGECTQFIYVRTRNGNSGGASCFFPYWDGSRNVSGCISDNERPTPWCATTQDYKTDQKWGECILSNKTVKTKGGNGDGADCVFPYEYFGKTYHTCNSETYYKPWCATVYPYKGNGKYGICKLPIF